MGSGGLGVWVKGRKIEIYIGISGSRWGVFVRKLCQNKLEITHFESGTPMKTQINSGTPYPS
jgi:hypothetical protein